MATLSEYAQFSAIVYAKTDENELPLTTGWQQLTWQADTLSGFSAGAYKKGDDIVISYTGTNGALAGDFVWANIPAGAGLPSAQVLSAIKFYLDVRDANPGATISFTGHSLGGGLASLMAVYFDKSATTFAPAPFMLSALNMATLGSYQATLLALGKSDAAFDAYTPNPTALYTARQANVEAHTIQGEILVDKLGRGGTIVDPAKDYFYDAGNSVPPVSLHSILLHAAVLRSPEFKLAVANVQSALPMIGDESLYASKPESSNKRDFMSKLMQDEWNWSGFGSYTPLRRFADDLLKLAPSTYGMASGTGIAEALVVAAMEYRYFKDATSATQLFTFDTYGLHFKYSDIGASSYKSLPKLAEAVNAYLTPEEQAVLNGRLIKQDAWHIQSGVGGMILHAGADNDAVIGGANSDGIWAGAGNDIVIGGANNDVLAGEAGNDCLLGGIGLDTYIINAGDGYDTILDTDGFGVVNIGGVEAKGKTSVTNAAKWIQLGNVWQDQEHGITYGLATLADGSQTLFITDLNGSTVEVKGWSDGELGIDLGTGASPAVAPATSLTLTGDLQPADQDSAASGIQEGYDDLNNLKVTAAADPDREDTLYDSVGNDHILGLGGSDYIYAHRGGDNLLEGGAGSDVVMSLGGNDQLFGKDQIADLAAAILASETQPGTGGRGDWLSAGGGTDTLVGDAGNDVLLGGENEDLLIGGGGNDNLWGDQRGSATREWALTRSIQPNAYIINITNASTVDAAIGAADVIYGGAGDDWIYGNQGNDIIDAGADNDVVFGGAGADVILGQAGNDVISGNGGPSNPQGDGADYIDGGAGNDTLFGASGNDYLLGGMGNDKLIGDDNGTLPADEGEDVLDGGAGDDTLWGNGKNDTLLGGAGVDTLYGEVGDDILDGGAGADLLQGGAGDDTYLNVTGEDRIFDTEGNNTIILAAANGLGAAGLNNQSWVGSDGYLHPQLQIGLDNGEVLKLESPYFGTGNSVIQFANGDALDVEALVSESLFTPLNLGLGDSGGRLYGGAGNEEWRIAA